MVALMTKRVLMVAFHFPPLVGSSGIQRTLRFAQHLPEFGWEPAVLSAHTRAYPQTAGESIREIRAIWKCEGLSRWMRQGISPCPAYSPAGLRYLTAGGAGALAPCLPDFDWYGISSRTSCGLPIQLRAHISSARPFTA